MSNVATATGTTNAADGAEGRVVSLPCVQVDEAQVRQHLDGVVRRTVEETLNALLDAEADHLCGARRYERTEALWGCQSAASASSAGQELLLLGTRPVNHVPARGEAA